jgi:hypothetical protein
LDLGAEPSTSTKLYGGETAFDRLNGKMSSCSQSKGALSFGKHINGIANAFAKVKAKVSNAVASFVSSLNPVHAFA